MKRTVTQTLEYDPKRESTWCVEDQPATKLAVNGAKSVTDTDLIAVLLTGAPNATELARTLYAKSGNNLNTLSHFSIEQLSNIKGLTYKKAVTLHAAFELGRRNNGEAQPLRSIRSSATVFEIMKHQRRACL